MGWFFFYFLQNWPSFCEKHVNRSCKHSKMKNLYMSIKDSYHRLRSYNLNPAKNLENFGRKRILGDKTWSQYYRQMRLLSVWSTLELHVFNSTNLHFPVLEEQPISENMQDKRITLWPWITSIVPSFFMSLRD